MRKKKVKKWPLVVVLLLICIVFGSLYVFDGFFEAKNFDEKNPDVLEKEEPKAKEYSATFTLGGNVLVNSNMWYDTLSAEGVYKFNDVFEYLNDIMKKSNINYYSQQSICISQRSKISL